MNAVVTALISPIGTWLAVTLLSIVLVRRRFVRTGAVGAALAAIWLCMWATPAASEWVIRRVESPFPPLTLATVAQAQAIVVLGGGMTPPSRSQPYGDLSRASDRVWHAARLQKAGKAPLVLLSGGSDPTVSIVAEAEAMRSFIVDLGVPDSALILEMESRNTRGNAKYSAKLLRERHISHIILVTSAMHMTRVLAEFRAEGLDVVPVATDHTFATPLGTLRAWLPAAEALDDSGRAFKEIVGRLLVYRH